MRVVSSLAVMASAIVLAATGSAMGSSSLMGTAMVKGTRSVEDFDRVRVEGAVIVAISIGQDRAMVPEDAASVQTIVSGGTLIVAPAPGQSSPSRIQITLPALRALAVSNGGQATVQGLSDEGEVAFSVLNDSQIIASGTAGRVDVEVRGPGRADLANLEARSASAKVDGAGVVRIFASSDLSASITGNGTIEYGGDPVNLAQAVSGSGVIRQY